MIRTTLFVLPVLIRFARVTRKHFTTLVYFALVEINERRRLFFQKFVYVFANIFFFILTQKSVAK